MATPRTVAFYTLGCKLNFSETSSIGRLFENQGYSEVSFEDGADIYVINTCSVTDFADRKCRKTVRAARKQSPHAHIVVVGCYAQLKPKEIAEIPGVDLVLGASEKFKILDYVDKLTEAPDQGLVFAADVKEANTFTSAFSFGDRTRSFLKVQDGCDYKCTFCTIPKARGSSRSDRIDNIVQQAREIVKLGVKEIVLTGVNIGDFGNGTEVIEGVKPKKEALFIDLIKELEPIEGVERFRISSIEPNLLTEEIIQFVAESTNFVPHFHIPLQSGNNKQLREMKRRYQRELYADRCHWIKKYLPEACIGVDVIVGFPGETDADFLETYHFIQNLDISYLHVFTYSEREQTEAATMPGTVPMHVRRERNEMLRILSEKKKKEFYEKHIGKNFPILVEAKHNDIYIFGFTPNYIKVAIPYSPSLVNQIISVTLLEFTYVDDEAVILGQPLSHVP